MKSTEIRSQNVTLLFNILGSNREPDPYSVRGPVGGGGGDCVACGAAGSGAGGSMSENVRAQTFLLPLRTDI